MNLKARFEIKQQLGEGSFSKIYQAYDNLLNREVALKMEKEDKSKKFLKFEYEVLKKLQTSKHIPRVFDFISSENTNSTFDCNFIVMECLGRNMANYKKSKSKFKIMSPYEILLQMLNAIEEVHESGVIHRDIKPSNFVIGGAKEDFVYIVDFGLSKIHLDKNKNPLPPREDTEFRGTLVYASLNAHNKKELGRRDDLWSFFFVILELLDETLPWRNYKEEKEDIHKIKEECLRNPIEKMFQTTLKNNKNILMIFNHINSLKYDSKPNYALIRSLLADMKMENEGLKINYKGKKFPINLNLLKEKINFQNNKTTNPLFDLINFKSSLSKDVHQTDQTELNNTNMPNNLDQKEFYIQNFLNNYVSQPKERNQTFLTGKRKREEKEELKEKLSCLSNTNKDLQSSKEISKISNEFLKSVFSRMESFVSDVKTNAHTPTYYDPEKISKKNHLEEKNFYLKYNRFYDSLNLKIERNLINYMMKNLDKIPTIYKQTRK